MEDVQNIVYENIKKNIDIYNERANNPRKYLCPHLNANLADMFQRTSVKAIGFEYLWDLYGDYSGEGFTIYLTTTGYVSPKPFVPSDVKEEVIKQCKEKGHKIKEIIYVDKELCDLCENNKIFIPLW